MNTRTYTLLGSTTYDADKTEIIDLDVQDPISQIAVVYRPVNVVTGTQLAHPAASITKIEIVDGSEVLWSLSGREAQALDYYHRQIEPFNYMDITDGGSPMVTIMLNFGRFLFDSELAFNPLNYKNPQLKISIDLNAQSADIVAGSMQVFAELFDEKVITPVGYLMGKEVESYTLGDNAHHYVDMPTDKVWRKLLVRAQRNGTDWASQIAHIKLSQDADKKVIFDHDSFPFAAHQASQVRPYREHIFGSGNIAARYGYCTPGFHVRFASTAWRATIGGGDQAFFGGSGGRFQYIQAVAGPNWQAIVEGWLPHSVVEYPFGLQQDIGDWFDPVNVGSMKLDITGGAAVDTQPCDVFLQELVKY